jgi:hypothetical protein
MKSIACSRCGEAFVAERTEAGALQSRFCPDCLEEKLLEKNFPSQEVRQSWFQLFRKANRFRRVAYLFSLWKKV